MRIFAVLIVATMAIGATACGGRTRPGFAPAAAAALTSANITFLNRDDGKDTASAVTIELLRNNAELGAEARTVGTHFEHDTASAPLALSLAGPFTKADVGGGRLRIRLTPDGKDVWTFDMRLVLTFADGAMQRFAWNGIRLDNADPERTFPLEPARFP